MPIHATIEARENIGSQRGTARMRMRIEAPGSLGTGQGTTVVIHNLSTTGMLIETTSDLTIGQRIMVALPEVPDLAATIVWRSEALAGCRFDHPLSRATLSATQLRHPLPADVDPAVVADPGELLPQRLYRLRKERGLSRAALSARTGLSKPSIWAWETGKTIPRRGSLAALADAFGISERELVIGGFAASVSESTDNVGSAEQIQALVDESKERIAALAGVKAANVKITIEL